uniref:Homeobox domain-containing protein n=1 Tax=Ganoderma boninense TaxID=34458 RepID=A0A5K1JTJ6_9APHY|nr:Uncharacterized protein [Ganoderma boninense]
MASTTAPYSYPSPHQPYGNLNASLHPDHISEYSSLAAWHGGHPPVYPPQARGKLAPLQPPRPPSSHPSSESSDPYPPPVPERNRQLGVPSSATVPHSSRPLNNTTTSRSSLKKTKQSGAQLQWVAYSPSESTRQPWPNANPSTCVCGASFNAPRERERHWRAYKCGSAAPLQPAAAAADLFAIPGKYGRQKAHEVDKKWLAVLLEKFEENPYPSKEVRTELAWKMRVPRYAVDNWFWWEREAREM